MKKNIFTAIAVFILSIILFFNVSTTTTSIIAAKEVIKDSISETYIPSDSIFIEKLSGKVLTAEEIEIKPIKLEVNAKEEVIVKPQKPNYTATSPKEETTTKREELTTKPVEQTTVIEKEETSTTVQVDEDIWAKRKAQYPIATQIWLYMKDLGWSDIVCAGIMGNMMAEVGGNTLNLQPYLYGYDSYATYYGICQWNLSYASSGLNGASVLGQCNYLRDTIRKEMNTFGYKYSSSMNYANFLALTSPSEAALVFAKCYERCASFSYNIRQTNAQKAYTYFVG